VVVPIPDVRGRLEILKVHTQRIPLDEHVDLNVLARGTPGFSGADLENLVNEAALLAARRNKENVGMEEFELAKDKVLMGVERKSMIISDEEKRITAYHEGGHALVASLLPGSDPVHKVTIIPRGRALGLTQQLPIDERHTYPKQYLVNRIAVLLGGRAAEELVLRDFTTGAGNDLERATEMARKMVCEWGMSEGMGPLTYGQKEEAIFLGREIARHRDYSDSTAELIDREIRHIVEACYQKALQVIRDHMGTLNRLAEELLKKEVLDAKELEALIRGGAPTPGPEGVPGVVSGGAEAEPEPGARASSTG
jgi:cell division protease FtsH